MAVKKKRKRRAPRISKSVSLKDVETPEEQRKKFPKKLLAAFINLGETKVRGTMYDFEYYEWSEEAYELYRIEAKKYLGGLINDPIESGRLVVRLSKATMDLHDEQKKKTKKEKANQSEKN